MELDHKFNKASGEKDDAEYRSKWDDAEVDSHYKIQFSVHSK